MCVRHVFYSPMNRSYPFSKSVPLNFTYVFSLFSSLQWDRITTVGWSWYFPPHTRITRVDRNLIFPLSYRKVELAIVSYFPFLLPRSGGL